MRGSSGSVYTLLFITLCLLSVVSSLSEDYCVQFLKAHMSTIDAELMDDSFLIDNARAALQTRTTYPWGHSIPDIIFLNDVLPYASLREPRDLWRSGNFTNFMRLIVSNCHDIPCAVAALNTHAWNIRDPAIIFEPSPPNHINSYSPFETIRRGNSSCTGLAIFLVDALRAVGIPARVAGTPHWNLGSEKCPNGDSDPPCGNHNWVEVFVPSKGWSFVDQRRPDLEVLPLNESFFHPEQSSKQRGDSENHTIFASSFAAPEWLIHQEGYWVGAGVEPGRRFPMVWDLKEYSVHAWNVGATYWVKGGVSREEI